MSISKSGTADLSTTTTRQPVSCKALVFVTVVGTVFAVTFLVIGILSLLGHIPAMSSSVSGATATAIAMTAYGAVQLVVVAIGAFALSRLGIERRPVQVKA